MSEEANHKKDSKNDKKALLSTLAQTINPIMKEIQSDQHSLQMPQLALRCAQFFHSISQYCVGYYRNYLKEEESKKTKFIKKQEKEKSQRGGRRGRKRGQDKQANSGTSQNRLQPPKKPLTAYIIYFQDKKPMFVQRYPSLNLSELTKLIAKQWKQLSQSQKQVYLDRASDDRKRYQEQMTQFKTLYSKLYGKITEVFEVKDKDFEDQQIEAIINAEKAISLQDQQNEEQIVAQKEEADQVKEDNEMQAEQDQSEQEDEGADQGAEEGAEGEAISSDSEGHANGVKDASEQDSQGQQEEEESEQNQRSSPEKPEQKQD